MICMRTLLRMRDGLLPQQHKRGTLYSIYSRERKQLFFGFRCRRRFAVSWLLNSVPCLSKRVEILRRSSLEFAKKAPRKKIFQ